MPTENNRLLSLLAGTVLTAVLVAVAYWAQSVLIPIALAILLTFVLSPVVARLHRRGLNRIFSVAITVGTVILLLGGMGTLISREVSQLAATLPDRREVIKEKIASAKHWLGGETESRLSKLVGEVSEQISPETPNVPVVKTETTLGSRLESYVSPAAELLGQAAFTFILTIFMLLRREDLRNRAIRLLGDVRIMATTRAVDDASQRISRYLLSQLLLNTAFGLTIAVVFFAIGVKYSILWGVIATIMRYVPYIGSWIGVILPFTFSITMTPTWGGEWGQPLFVLFFYLGLELICGNFVEPRLFGRSMGVSEVAQLVAAALWMFLWGPIGLILSGPLTACLLVLGRHVPRFRFLVVLLGDEPPLSPQDAFYQRLVAGDQDEASEVAHEAAKQIGVDACLDTVLVPALCLARHDAAIGELDSADMKFIVNAVREVTEELAEERESAAADSEDAVRVLLCPTRDRSEQAAVEAFATMLDPQRWNARVAGGELVASELIELVAEHEPQVIVIATLPPGGLSHTNYLIARLRKHYSDLKIIVGRWGGEQVEDRNRENAIRNVEAITHTLLGTRKKLDEMHAILNAQEPGRNLTPASNHRVAAGV